MTTVITTLIEAGHAYYDGDTLMGIASDGVHLSLMCATEEETLRYLADHPTPETW